MTISKPKYSILFLILFSFCQKQVECNPKDFKTGTFEFTKEIKEKKQTSTFQRTDKFQIETYQGKTDTATVRWVNDYEFILKKLHPKNKIEEKAISMRILSTKGKTYTFEYAIVGDSKKQIGRVTKIN
ncbi:MAG: DNA topoisomerase IV [Flavobacterium sp.]